jgi:hypothetical protein
MEMTPVSSSNLAAVGYDNESATLRIQFLHGGIYDYQGVPADIYEGLINAGSKGQFFDKFIKKGGFPYSKI